MATALDIQPTHGSQIRFFMREARNPLSPYKYVGCLTLGGPTQDLGASEPVYCASSDFRDAFDIVDDVPRAQALGTSDITVLADRFLRDIFWKLKEQRCPVDLQAVFGSCQSPSDFTNWDSKELYSFVRLTNFGNSALNPSDPGENAKVNITGSINFREWVRLQEIVFEEQADSVVLAEIVDGFFFDTPNCGDCGDPSDGSRKSYWLALSNSGSPGLSSQVVYSTDDGATWSTLDINGLAGLSAVGAVPFGTYMVVISTAAGGHFYNLFSNINTGTAGTWAAKTGISNGYVAGKSPTCIYGRGSSAFIGGQGGYVYYMQHPTKTVTVLTNGSVTAQDLRAIHGFGRLVVAVGANNALIRSLNDGTSFALLTGPAVGVALNAVRCLSEKIWLIGANNGNVYVTINGGTTWTALTPDPAATTINSIWNANEHVVYVALEAGGAGKVYRSTDGGNTFSNIGPHISGLPTCQRISVVSGFGNNKIGAGGRKTVGGDGLLAIAQAS